ISDTKGSEIIRNQDMKNTDIIELHHTYHPFVSPIVFSVPMQLIAYYTAFFKGTDVDQPRNLAKSVTVE
ncbi:MAG: glutamine--fructose-6-phosphate aminotransferase, partial [Alphaproteobacteria bacterium]|nr:glutamine--fructose-6-phosphate aminotransferase [Alphaproteobacteria bacterium]